MSDDWLQSKLQEEPCFMLEFSDQQQLLVSRTRLEALCSALPALPFLLFGHPSMKEKVAERRSDSGIMVLTLMDVDLPIEIFLHVMNAVSGVTELPTEKSQIDYLLDAVNLLGGCDQIENDIRIRTESRWPKHPQDDVNDKFEWKQLVFSDSYDIREQHESLFDEGWFPVNDVSFEQIGEGFFGTNLLQRPKGHTSGAQENSPDS